MTYYEGSEPYIFLNYAPADTDRIAPVLTALEREGFRLWSAEAVKPGEERIERVAEHLEKAHCCVCILTKGFEEAKDQHKVLYFAVNEGVPVLAVYLEEVKLTAGVRMQLSISPTFHRAQYAFQMAFIGALCNADLLRACKELVAEMPETETAPEQPTPPTDPADTTPRAEPRADTASVCASSSVSVDQALTSSSSVRYSEGLEFRSMGDGTYAVVGMGSCRDRELVIPPTTPEGGKVTYIGSFAFEKNTGLTHVSIPYGVTTIGRYAFHLCERLRRVDIPDSVTHIEDSAFDNCKLLPRIAIPPKVTRIGELAFSGCEYLKEVVFPHHVDKMDIGGFAFLGCRGMDRINIPQGVVLIGPYAFRFCSGLTHIFIPQSVEIIEELAFADIRNVTIYCEHPSQPEEWHPDWNPQNHHVVWNYKPE